MTSNQIYGEFTPKYLYIKQHIITGLLYFGVTTNPNPIKYTGSGIYWLRHIKKHGTEHVVTLWHERFTDKDELVQFALNFSKSMDIVRSKSWANLKEENGVDGGNDKGHGLGRKHTPETIIKLKNHFVNNHWSKLGFSHPLKGQSHSERSKHKESEKKCKNIITLTSPTGEILLFTTTRELIIFLDSNQLSFDGIKKYANTGPIPDITTPNRHRYPKRINLTGWEVVIVPKPPLLV